LAPSKGPRRGTEALFVSGPSDVGIVAMKVAVASMSHVAALAE
jgi:hypothetical protein